MINYSKEQVENIGKQVKRLKSMSKEAVSLLNNVVTPDLVSEMNPMQKAFMDRANSAFKNDDSKSLEQKMKELNNLTANIQGLF